MRLLQQAGSSAWRRHRHRHGVLRPGAAILLFGERAAGSICWASTAWASRTWDFVLLLLASRATVYAYTWVSGSVFSWLIGPATAALVIVLFNIVNPPPLTPDIDGDPSTGLWLAFAASILMAAGAVLSTARISVAFAPADGAAAQPGRRTLRARPGGGRARADRAGRPRRARRAAARRPGDAADGAHAAVAIIAARSRGPRMACLASSRSASTSSTCRRSSPP